ncbi:FtsJ-like methyltransferase-domain-containing protein [Podospora didyma]|uniref:rRNA methyltransferase 2, mitochondrial n=1 Tax=Podospora didyma TaxID=330526 RepID=A0AAE0U915_9PEZI|nr:FtsJ-like methyltransferase-domain-containing protein [Podospora didyma]
MPSKNASRCVNTDSEKRTELVHNSDMKYHRTRHQTELLIKEEEARRLTLRGLLLRDDNASLKGQIAQKIAQIKDLADQGNDVRIQLDSLQQKCRRQETLMQTQSREITQLKEELSTYSSVSQDSAKLLSEKLALSREVAVIKPELEHLRSQLSHQMDVLAEKLALERQLNALEVELANEKRAAQKALQDQEREKQEEEELRKQVRELEKQLAKEKRAAEKNVQSKDDEAEGELQSLREQLARSEKNLAAQKRKVEQLTKTQESAANDAEEELEQLRQTEELAKLQEKLANVEKALATEKKEKARIQKENEQALADVEERQQAYETKLEKFKAKFRETQQELKQCQADLEKAREQSVTIPSTKTTTVPTKKPAAKGPGRKKRSSNEISLDDKILATPNKDDRPKRPLKKRGFDPSTMVEKSNFSITPFLNKTVNLSDLSPKASGEEATRTMPTIQLGKPSEEATVTAPMAVNDDEPTDTEELAPKADEKQPRGRKPKVLADAPPSKKNLTVRNPKTPLSGSPLEKVAEEEADESGEQENRSAESAGLSAPATKTVLKAKAQPAEARSSGGASAPTTEAEPKKKKRKVLGASAKPTNIFEEEDEGERVVVAPAPAAAAAVASKRPPKAGLNGARAFAGKAAMRAGGAKNPFAGATLARTLLGPLLLSFCPSQPHAQAVLATHHARYSSSNSRWKQRQGTDSFARDAKVQGLKSRAAFKLLEMDAKYRLFKRDLPQNAPGQVVVDLGFAPGSWSQVALERTKPNGSVLGIDLIPAQPPKGVSVIQGNFLSPGVQGLVKRFLLEAERKRRVQRKADTEAEAGAEVGLGEDGGDIFVGNRPSYIDMERREAALDTNTETTSSSSSRESAAESGPVEEQNGGKATEVMKRRLVDVILSDMSEPWPQTSGFTVRSLSNPHIRLMNTSGIPFKDHAGSMDLCLAALSFASETLKPGGHFVCKFYQGAEDKAFENKLKKMFAKVHREKPDSSRSESREAFFVALKRKGGVTLEDIEGPR